MSLAEPLYSSSCDRVRSLAPFDDVKAYSVQMIHTNTHKDYVECNLFYSTLVSLTIFSSMHVCVLHIQMGERDAFIICVGHRNFDICSSVNETTNNIFIFCGILRRSRTESMLPLTHNNTHTHTIHFKHFYGWFFVDPMRYMLSSSSSN